MHQTPQYDARGQASNFFPDKWSAVGGADALRRRLRQRRLSVHRHQPPGDEPADRAVPRPEHHAGDRHDRAQHRQRRPTASCRPARASRSRPTCSPALGVGAAVRHGLRPDRPAADRAARRRRAVLRPAVRQRRLRAGAEPAGDARASRCATASCRRSARAASPPKRRRRCRSTSTTARCPRRAQWNAGVQIALPWASVARRRPTSASTATTSSKASTSTRSTSARRSCRQNQDPTLAPTTPGRHVACRPIEMRAFRGYSSITQNVSRGWITHHSLQLSFNRRFRNGLSFGFNDTIGLSTDRQRRRAPAAQPRRHGLVPRRPGARPTSCLQTPPTRHTMKGNFVWDLPDLHAASATSLRALGAGRQRLAVVRHLDGVDRRTRTPSASTTRAAAAT